VRRLRQQFVQGAGIELQNVLPAHELKRVVKTYAGEYRDRLYPPLTTLALFMSQALSQDGACQDAVARHLSERSDRGISPCSLNTGPYCKARQRLPVELVMSLQRAIGRRMAGRLPEGWRWCGRSVKLLDGTTVSMPDTVSNQEVFPQNPEQKPGLGFPLARLVAVVCLGSGAIMDWAMGPYQGKGSGEQALFRTLFDCLDAGDVVLADRYHCTYWTLAMLKLGGIDAVMRQHQLRLYDFRRGKRLGKRDHIAQWKRPIRPDWMDEATYATIPEEISVREVEVRGRVLVTTLLDPCAATPIQLGQLYQQRWQVELDLRSIKIAIGIDVLRCKTPEMVRKELAVHLLAYTLVRAVMAQAANLTGVLARALSFKGALQLLNAYHQQLRHSAGARACIMISHVLGAVAMLRLPVRPGRFEPRAIKRRPKQHWLLNVPRAVARAAIIAQRQHLLR
jgi:DDE family transposase